MEFTKYTLLYLFTLTLLGFRTNINMNGISGYYRSNRSTHFKKISLFVFIKK